MQPGLRRGAGGGARARPLRGGRRRAAAHLRGRAHGLRVAPAGRRLGAGRARCSSTGPYAVQSRGRRVRPVGWVQSSAMLVRREASAGVGHLDPGFFVYSDETDFCKRLHDSGWRILFVPGARAVHHDQLATDAGGHAAPDRGVPPRPRPLPAQARAPADAAPLDGMLDLGLPRPRGGRVGASRPRPAPLPAARAPAAAAGERRGVARGRGGPQPRSRPRRAPAPTERYAGGGLLR